MVIFLTIEAVFFGYNGVIFGVYKTELGLLIIVLLFFLYFVLSMFGGF
jgi:tryptophan-rich sensory protein